MLKKKVRKQTSIRTYYIPEDARELQEKIDELAYKEQVTVGAVIIDALKEYYEKHGDGNPVYTLDQWQDPNFKAVPALFRDMDSWKDHYEKITPAALHDMDKQLTMIIKIHNQKYKEFENE